MIQAEERLGAQVDYVADIRAKESSTQVEERLKTQTNYVANVRAIESSSKKGEVKR